MSTTRQADQWKVVVGRSHTLRAGGDGASEIDPEPEPLHELPHPRGLFAAVGLRDQRVQHDGLMPFRRESIRDVRADEARPTGHQNPHAAAYPAGSAAPHRQPAHSAYGCFRCNTVESAVRSFAFARFIAADITGAATAPNPDGSPRLRRIILVPSATGCHV
jgi:hypothetical protein